MAGKIEHKILAFDISDIIESKNDAGINVATVTGYAAYKNNIDLGGDRIIDGAFKRGLRGNKGKWPVLRDHSPSIKDTVGENISAKEDDIGLYTTTEINLDTEAGRDTLSKVKHAKSTGRGMGLSIGYRPDGFEYVKEKSGTVRELKEVTIFEHSFTNFPMNPKANVLTVKSVCDSGDKEAIAQKKRDLEQVLRDEGCSKSEAKAAVSALFAERDARENEAKADAEIERAGVDTLKALSNLITNGDN